MGVIIKVRERFGAVLVGVISLAIISFLLMDALSSNNNLLSGQDTTAGLIDGEEISIQEYEQRVQEAIENYKLSNQVNAVDEQTMNSIRQQTWDDYVSDVIYTKEFQELGIDLTADELFDLIQGENPHPAVVQSFSDPNTGQFDKNQVLRFLQNLDNDQTGETRTRWLNFEKFLKKDRLQTKYNVAISKGIHIPDPIAEANYKVSETSIDIDFVFLPYSDIPDAEIEISDADLENYLKANQSDFIQEKSRTIQYVSFPIYPSSEDTAAAFAWIEEHKAKFKAANNDSTFLKLYSDSRLDGNYYEKDQLRSSFADSIFESEQGTFIGPYFENGAYVVAKLQDRKMIPDSVKASHILLTVTTQQELESKRALADSLAELVREGVDFKKLAGRYSQDEATKFSAGSWGWVEPNEKFQTINRALFYQMEEGDVKVVGSDRGFHVIKADKSTPSREAVRVGFLKRNITPSIETERSVYRDANEFLGQYNTAEKFKSADEEYSVRKAENIKINNNSITGIGSAREIVRWAYTTNPGEVSNVFALDDSYVVALLENAKEKGPAKVKDVRSQLELAVKREKKAAILSPKLEGSDLQSIADKNSVSVKSASGLSFSNNFITGVGLETKVVNKLLALEENSLSEPLAGNNGVFRAKVTAKSVPASLSNYAQQKMQMTTQFQTGLQAKVTEALKKASDVKDERYKFY
ncbi:MAG: peptidylprolyl isomerase [Chitinophagales bacterium]